MISSIFDFRNKSKPDGVGATLQTETTIDTFLNTQWFEGNSFSSRGTINHVRLTVFIAVVSADRASILIAVSRFRNHKPRLILAVSQFLVIYDSRIQTHTDVILVVDSWYLDITISAIFLKKKKKERNDL